MLEPEGNGMPQFGFGGVGPELNKLFHSQWNNLATYFKTRSLKDWLENPKTKQYRIIGTLWNESLISE